MDKSLTRSSSTFFGRPPPGLAPPLAIGFELFKQIYLIFTSY
jgi:hypothetical protein